MDDLQEEQKLDKAMPWVGLYIAAASAACTLAMAADAFNGFRRKKLWFPCTYFSLNPTSLTLLGVAMKLTMDLTAVMKNIKIAKLTTLIFLSTTMGNFMSSLGSIDVKHLLSNVVALAILVVTVLVDVIIRFIMLTVVNFYIAPMILMFLSLATLVSLAIACPAMKRSLEATYREKHRLAVKEEVRLQRKEGLGIDERRSCMMKYFVMATTSNPQFVMARSVVCTTSALLCLIALIVLPIAYVFVWRRYEGPSVYKASVEWILYTQTVGVAVATIAPVSRWFLVVSFKYSTMRMNRVRDEIKIENYWIQTLVDMRESFSCLQIGQGKFLHDAKWFAITFCIGIQILIVSLSKLFVFLSALLMTPFFCFWKNICSTVITSESNKDQNFSRYVLLLEGEPELPRAMVRNICSKADIIIQTGKMRQPKSLTNLVKKSVNFKGLGQFDSHQIPNLHSQEPPNCWSLPVVTLTSIALAIPHASEKKREELLRSVREGLSLAKLVEKTLVKNDQLRNIKEATNISWLRVSLYMKWLDFDLRKISLDCKNSKEMLRDLSAKAETIVVEYLKGSFVEDPLDWPARVIAANSMYRISRSVALSVDEDDDDGVFEKLCVMIADIMAACLTNLPNVITEMCQGSAIEKRDKSVRKAFLLLGKTEEIVEAVRRQEWPPMDHVTAAEIEEWRAWFRRSDETVAAATVSSANEQHLAIQVDI